MIKFKYYGHIFNGEFGLINNLDFKFSGNQLIKLNRKALANVEVIKGDINKDGIVNFTDLMSLHFNLDDTIFPKPLAYLDLKVCYSFLDKGNFSFVGFLFSISFNFY